MITLREVQRTIPEEARKSCEKPSLPPLRALSERETLRFWNKDRVNLIDCEEKRAAAVQAAAAP